MDNEILRVDSKESFSSISDEGEDTSSSDEEEEDPEVSLWKHLENYYDKNYINYEVNHIDDYLHNQVWNVYYDQKYDLTYIFLAKIKLVCGKKVETTTSKKIPKYLNHHMKDELIALEVHSDGVVRLDLFIELWNLDDRIIKDADHTKKPLMHHRILSVTNTLHESMNTFQMM